MATRSLWTLFGQLDDQDSGDNRTNARRTILVRKARHSQNAINQIFEAPRDYNLRRRILLYAGRQAAASFRIAAVNADAQVTDLVDEAIFYEPFTYWDWNGYDRDREEPRKRRIIWERERSFIAEGDAYTHSFPTPSQQWSKFKDRVEGSDHVRNSVKRLTLAAWMEPSDLIWIAKSLPNLEALDLSLIAKCEELQESTSNDTDDESDLPKWPQYLRYLARNATSDHVLSFLQRLKWIGIPDSRSVPPQHRDTFGNVARKCTNLKTLCVRGEYDADIDSCIPNPHKHVCQFKRDTIDIAPESVTTIELRLAIGFMPFLLKHIHESKPNVKRVGIDIGAWVQMYPLRDPWKKKLSTDRVARKAIEAANQQIYERITVRYASQKLRQAPRVQFQPSASDTVVEARQDQLNSYFHDKSGMPIRTRKEGKEAHDHDCDIESVNETSRDVNRATTLSRMLGKLHRAFKTQGDIEPFALEPEVKARGTDPLNPLALVQEQLKGFERYGEALEGPLTTETYSWLGSKFKWKPVLDWDRLVNQSTMKECVDPDLVPRDWKKTFRLIRTCLERMNEAHIPVHILIGRRDPQLSSCYWGWLANERNQESGVAAPFSANLTHIAEHVDTLSILYDFRNPLSRDRLEEIQGKDPDKKPPAFCPKRVCPWGSVKECPFTPNHGPGAKKQKMANKARLNSGLKPAQVFEGDPPPGEMHAEPFSLSTDEPSLHREAREAVFAREMRGWYHFWKHNAPSFTKLTMLRIRMPQKFDNVWSYWLAQLLKQEIGWTCVMHTAEIEHAQTHLDLMETFPGESEDKFRHAKLLQEWPAGPFVRRTWVWENYAPLSKTGLDKNAKDRKRHAWGNRVWGGTFSSYTEAIDQKEASKADQYVQICEERERRREMETDWVQQSKVAEYSLDLYRSEDDEHEDEDADWNIESASPYIQGLRNHAGNYYRAAMSHFADQVQREPLPPQTHPNYYMYESLRFNASLLPYSRVPYNGIFAPADDTYQENIRCAGTDSEVSSRDDSGSEAVGSQEFHFVPDEVAAPGQKTHPDNPPPEVQNANVPLAQEQNLNVPPPEDENPIVLRPQEQDPNIPPPEEQNLTNPPSEAQNSNDPSLEEQNLNVPLPEARSEELPASARQRSRSKTPSSRPRPSTQTPASAKSATSAKSTTSDNLQKFSPLQPKENPKEQPELPSPQTKGLGRPKRKARKDLDDTQSGVNPAVPGDDNDVDDDDEDEDTNDEGNNGGKGNKRRRVSGDAWVPADGTATAAATGPTTRGRRGRQQGTVLAAPAPTAPTAPKRTTRAGRGGAGAKTAAAGKTTTKAAAKTATKTAAKTVQPRSKAGAKTGRVVQRTASEAADPEVDDSEYMTWTNAQLQAELRRRKSVPWEKNWRKRQLIRALVDDDKNGDDDEDNEE